MMIALRAWEEELNNSSHQYRPHPSAKLQVHERQNGHAQSLTSTLMCMVVITSSETSVQGERKRRGL